MDEHSALLRLVRAAAVLDGVDATTEDAGVRTGSRSASVLLPWSEVARALGPDGPLDRAPRLRLAVLLALHRRLAELGPQGPARLAAAARPLALPAGHPLAPAQGWVLEHVPGGVLELGPGVHGLLPGSDDVLPLPASVAAAAGFDAAAAWPGLRELGEAAAVSAVRRDAPGGGRPTTLRGADGVDALTLLALPAARGGLAGPVAAPGRDLVWLGDRALDGPFLHAVRMLTAPARRGVPEPLLATPELLTGLPRPPGRRAAQRSGGSATGS